MMMVNDEVNLIVPLLQETGLVATNPQQPMRPSAFAPVAAHADPDIEELAPQPMAGPSAFASAAAFAEPELEEPAGKEFPQGTLEFPQVSTPDLTTIRSWQSASNQWVH